MKTGKIFARFFALILLFPVSAFAGPKPHSKVLRVGVALRLKDEFNETVLAMMRGIETAKVLFEKAHPGVKVDLVPYAHGEDLESVVEASRSAIQDGVPAVIGGELSEESFVLRDQLGPKKIVFITPTSSNPAVTENQPYAFRGCFSDRVVASKLAEFTLDSLKPKAVGVLHNVSSPYTDFLSNQFIETFNAHLKKTGKTIPLHEEKVIRDTTDFKSIIQRFQEKSVTHIAMPVHQTDFLRFSLQAAKMNFFPVYVGSDGWGSNENVIRKFVKEAPEGSKFIGYRNSYWKEDVSSEMAQTFKKEYQKKYAVSPTAWSAISFDTAWVLFSAMTKAKDATDGETIRDQLEKIRVQNLVTSREFSFGPDHSPRKDLFIYRLDRNGINYEATLK